MDSKDLIQHYDKDYFLNRVEGHKEFKAGGIDEKKKWFVETANVKNKNVMDVGCGRGELANYAKTIGGYSFGVDYSEDAIRIAKNKFPDVVFYNHDISRFYTYAYSPEIIFMIDILEHITVKELISFMNNVCNNSCLNLQLFASTPIDIKRGQYKGMHITQWTKESLIEIFGYYFTSVMVIPGIHKGQYFMQCKGAK